MMYLGMGEEETLANIVKKLTLYGAEQIWSPWSSIQKPFYPSDMALLFEGEHHKSLRTKPALENPFQAHELVGIVSLFKPDSISSLISQSFF